MYKILGNELKFTGDGGKMGLSEILDSSNDFRSVNNMKIHQKWHWSVMSFICIQELPEENLGDFFQYLF